MIRRATPDDAARLADLGARTFRETFAAYNRPEDMEAFLSTAYGADVQLEEIVDPARITVVVEEGDALIAYAQLRVHLPQIEIGRFYVDSAWHGRGIAQSLMSAVLEIARDMGATRLWLGVWERNARAIAFYEKCGFVDCGSQPFLLGSDLQTDRVMERPV
jgi:ribosomal protein S18 acetylase RimI-like enzyme